MADEQDSAEGGPLLEGVLLEESSDDDDEEDGAGGLELDAQQAAEIRQIFLTTLPDYLQPIREMVARLSSEPDDEGEIRGALAKTVASIAEAASRVSLDDIERSMHALREDVMLLGDPAEPQQALTKRIAAALETLGDLAEQGGAPPRAESRSETVVAALRGIDGVDGAALQRLVSAGVVYVDQLLDADPGEVAIVSGLGADTVAAIVRALALRGSSASAGPPASASPAPIPQPPQPPAPQATALASQPPAKVAQSSPSIPPEPAEPPSATPGAADAADAGASSDLRGAIQKLVDEELSLEDLRGAALRLRLSVQSSREEVVALERQCDALRAAFGSARELAAEKLAELAKAQARMAALERDASATNAELDRVGSRLEALKKERLEAIDELARLADDAASLTERVTRVLDSHSDS